MAKTKLEVLVDTAMANGDVHPHNLTCLSEARRGAAGVHMFFYQGKIYCFAEYNCQMSNYVGGDGLPVCQREQYSRDVANRNESMGTNR